MLVFGDWSFVCTVVMCPSAGSGSQTASQSHDRNVRQFPHSGFRRCPTVIKAVIQRNLLLTLIKHLVSDVSTLPTSLTSAADFIMCLENHLRLIWKHAFLIVRWEILIIPANRVEVIQKDSLSQRHGKLRHATLYCIMLVRERGLISACRRLTSGVLSSPAPWDRFSRHMFMEKSTLKSTEWAERCWQVYCKALFRWKSPPSYVMEGLYAVIWRG